MTNQRESKTFSEQRSAWERELLARIREVAQGSTFRSLGDDTGVHPETVRRYLKHGRPSAFFVAALCRAKGLSPDWLLFGQGPRLRDSIGPAVEPKPVPAVSRAGGTN